MHRQLNLHIYPFQSPQPVTLTHLHLHSPPFVGMPTPVLHHLTRVERPLPSARHPLAGLWKGHCGRHGVQVMALTYDFSGPAARIVATKV